MNFVEPSYVSEWKPKLLAPADFRSFAGLDEICGDIVGAIEGRLGRADTRERCERAIWAFVGSLHGCYREGRPLGVPLSTKSYRASKRYNPKWFAYRTIKKVFDLLVAHGYVRAWKGYPGFGDGGFITKVYASDKLVEIFEANDLSYTCNMKELVQLKDEDKQLMEYSDNKYTMHKRDITQGYNDYMEGFEIMHHGQRLDAHLHTVNSRGDWECNGRYHNSAGGAQSLSKEDRAEITFRHPQWKSPESSAEFDFDSMHPNLIYGLINVSPATDGSGDLYMPVVKLLKASESIRGGVKLMMLTMINAKDDAAAIRAFHHTINEARQRNRTRKQKKLVALWGAMKADGVSSRDLMDGIKRVHSPIKHWFCSDAGIRLMRHDSDIMTSIIERCLSADLPLLPIHDSVVVPASRYNEAKLICERAFSEHIDRVRGSC